jgi:antitoxin VapB
MALNIKNPEVERLATEVARLAKESKTEAIRQALADRKQRLLATGKRADKQERLFAFLSGHVWPQIPQELLEKRVTKKEREKILGYGPQGF